MSKEQKQFKQSIDLSRTKNFIGKVIALASDFWIKEDLTPKQAFVRYLVFLAVIVLSIEVPVLLINANDSTSISFALHVISLSAFSALFVYLITSQAKLLTTRQIITIAAVILLENIICFYADFGIYEYITVALETALFMYLLHASMSSLKFTKQNKAIVWLLVVVAFCLTFLLIAIDGEKIVAKLTYPEYIFQTIWFLLFISAIVFYYFKRRNNLSQQEKAILLLTLNVIFTIFVVKTQVRLANWNKDFYNALQSADVSEFWRQIGVFVVIVILYLSVLIYRLYYRMMLEINWRQWLTHGFLNRWLKSGTHYHMETHSKKTDNPDQRISVDVDVYTRQTLALSLDLFASLYTLFAFVFLLWSIRPILVLAALGYAIVGTFFAHLIGKPLIKLFFEQQKYEADFRYSLVRVRENGEGIALYRGEDSEKEILTIRFENIWKNWWLLMKYQKRMLGYQVAYSQTAILFPLLILSPMYFAKIIDFGAIFQSLRAFDSVRESLSWFIDNYTTLANWKSVVDRLTTFEESMQESETELKNSKVHITEGSNSIKTNNLNIFIKDDAKKYLIKDANIHIKPKDKVLIAGQSGAGKSTLIRTISGIWPFAEGDIERPDFSDILFVPQKLYLPLGNLKDILCYPKPSQNFSDEEVIGLLKRVSLAHICDDLHKVDSWSHRLSPGEQQRLAVVRIILNKPKWLFLDEATSALDEGMENNAYQLIFENLTEASIISVAHKPSVKKYHDYALFIDVEDKTITKKQI